MALMAGVIDYFLSHDLQHQPESLHYDVATCIGQYILHFNPNNNLSDDVNSLNSFLSL